MSVATNLIRKYKIKIIKATTTILAIVSFKFSKMAFVIFSREGDSVLCQICRKKFFNASLRWRLALYAGSFFASVLIALHLSLSPLVFANSSDVARKMQTPVKVGLGWSLKYNQSHPGVDKQKGSTEGSFYVTTTGKNLQEFINNLDGVRNLDIEFISPERE